MEYGTAAPAGTAATCSTIPQLLDDATRYRVVTRTQVVATSPVVTAGSRVNAGLRAAR